MTRITNSMLVRNYMTNTNRNLNNMQKLQNQLSSGKEINRPSDDPYKVSRSMMLYTEIDANKQYNENIKDVTNWLDTTDTALNQLNNVLSRVRELMVTAGNGAYGTDEKKAIQDEIKELQKQLCQILNTNFDGSYIFGGTKSTSKPVMIDENNQIAYVNKNGNPITIYLNATGEVVNEPITNNKQLEKNDKTYLDVNGKVTTSAKDKDGNTNTAIISSKSLYMDENGKITTATAGNKPIALIDNLYVNEKNNITTEAITKNKLMSTDNELYYVTPDGYVTTQQRSEGASVDNEQISTGTTLFCTADGRIKAQINNITISPGDRIMNWGDPLYENLNGDIVSYEETINKKFNTNDQLYLDENGNITNQATHMNINGTPEPNDPLHLASDENLYINNGILTKESDGNDIVVLSDALYLDVNGDVKALKYEETMPTDGKEIDSDTSLFIGDDGRITSKDGIVRDAEGEITTQNTPVIISDKLYLDKDKNITVSATTPTIEIETGEELYVDLNGNVVVTRTPNVLLPDVPIYKDVDGNVTTIKPNDGINDTPLNRGDCLYRDVNGNVTILETSKNSEIPADKKIFVDAKNNLTFDETAENKMLSLDDVKEFKQELNSVDISEERKNEIDIILKNSDVAQLLQIDSKLKVEVSQGVFIDYNINAVDVLEFTDSKTGEKISVVEELNKLISNLEEGGDVSKITNDGLAKMDSIISNLLQNRSKVGAMANRMESAEAKNKQENLNMTDILSKTEDIDFTEKMMEYSVMQTVYMASLQVSAKVLPTTILDYLR